VSLGVRVAVMVMVLTLWRVPESRNETASKHLDWRGAALATSGLGAITYALIEGPGGAYQLTPYDPAFEKKMKKAESIIGRYRNTLHALAK